MKKAIYILLASTAIALTACKTKIVDEPAPSTESTDPMRFTSATSNDQTGFAPSRSGARKAPLTQGFLVSCWKSYGILLQEHVVMPKYEVQYEVDPWYNSSRWGYVSDGSHAFYQTQYERYWDYSHFPYRFHAISPCPPHSEIGSFALGSLNYSIPSSVEYHSETCTDGLLRGGAEPYLVAEIERRPDGHDFDLIVADKDDPTKPQEINTGSTTLSRRVALPFHHLTSKIAFGFYCQDLGEPDPEQTYKVFDIRVEVVSDNYTTAAQGYSAGSLDNDPGYTMITGDFTNRTRVTGSAASPLLTVTDEPTGSNANWMSRCRDRKTAYMCKCKDGMLAIPQTGVQLKVSFKIAGRMIDDNLIHPYPGGGSISYDEENDVTVYKDLILTPTLDDGRTVDRVDWEENTRYTYYIVVSRYFLHEIVVCTCTVTPWEEVSGSLSTDLEQ